MIKFVRKGAGKALGLVADAGQLAQRTVKKVSTNPGHFVRKQAAASVQNPTMSAAAIGDVGLGAAYIKIGHPELATPAVPGLKNLAMIPVVSKTVGKVLPSQEKRTQIAKEMMSNSGKTKASKIGQKIEYYTNKAALGASNLGHSMQRIGLFSRYKNEEEREFSKVGKIVKKAVSGLKDTKKKAKEVAWKLELNPKETIKEGMATAAENPITVASQIAATPLHVAGAGAVGPAAQVVTAALPNSVPYVMGEAALKKHSRGYAKFTKKAGDSVRKSKTVDALLGKEPEVTLQNSGPRAKFKDKALYNLRSGLAGISNSVQAAGRTVSRMAQFSEVQRNYTIQEGHYTGPKDMEKVPGVIEVLGKATIGGSAVGALAGGVLNETGAVENTGILDGAKKGGKVGFFTGIALKALLNHLHKPMSKVKYQEVDRTLRREFGMYRIAGLTVGDTREKRKTYDEKFGTNDRDVLNYSINICINNNQVTMYTLGLSDDLLERLNKSLDYYCKKYSGMEYSSRVINSKTNTYSVNITFTNYEAISSFIMEISEVLGVRINLLNNDVLPETKIGKSEVKSEEKIFSNIPNFSKYDISQIFLKSGAKSISALAMGGPAAGFATMVHQTLKGTLDRMAKKELIRLVGGSRKDYDNDFLLSELKRLGYLEGPHYTKGVEKSNLNLSMICGKVILTSRTGSREDLMMPKILKNQDYKKTEINGKANLWTFLLTSKGSFDVFLKTLIGSVKPNIYD